MCNCQSPTTTPTQPNLTLPNKGWALHENDCRPPPPTRHPPGTQCRQYLSSYWPDFDQILTSTNHRAGVAQAYLEIRKYCRYSY